MSADYLRVARHAGALGSVSKLLQGVSRGCVLATRVARHHYDSSSLPTFLQNESRNARIRLPIRCRLVFSNQLYNDRRQRLIVSGLAGAAVFS